MVRKSIVSGIALAILFIPSQALLFHGKGFDSEGNFTGTTGISRPANVTILKEPRISRRGNLWDLKRATKEARKKTVLQKSNLRSAPRYMGSRAARNTPIVKTETRLQRAQRIIKERRAKRLQK